ncbi:hypothetical protein PGQ11_012726 [Apiospora arundinis]|uniref:Uncharacterized protein n=1 Tax=Apiospora arundinis TaxID=335852 RepID=A0ABR2I338_9PEZI
MHGMTQQEDREDRVLGLEDGSRQGEQALNTTTNPPTQYQPNYGVLVLRKPCKARLIGGIYEALPAPASIPKGMGPSWSLLIERQRYPLFPSAVGWVDLGTSTQTSKPPL